ncbi:polysaccharide pyruvyl transferase family protein [Streptomyces tremellae]|uniref:Polysaccharide pyruvyl transferase domain-containing protein n=1 Tax=Streptomyces tremellae TaxID=1124239 RepID=A0ABP7EXU5_9ACTN
MTNSERELIYLVGPAGIPNYGDELIAATWLRHLARTAPGADVFLDCMDPGAAARRMEDLHPRVHFHRALWELCVRHWSADPALTAAAVADAVRAPGTCPDLAAPLGHLRRARVVHLLGGGFINSLWAPFAGLLAGITAATRLTGARAAMTGQGLWPVAGSPELIRSLAGRFDVVDVRDAASARLLDAGDGVHSCDDVFLDVEGGLHDHRGVPDVMLSLQSLLSDTRSEDLVAHFARVARAWGARGEQIGLLECAPGQDEQILALAREALPGARVYTMGDVLASGLPVAPGQAWLTTRFHPHLVAAAGGASGVAVSVRADYYGTKHRSLTAVGSPWRVLDADVTDVPERPAAGGYTPEALRCMREAKRAVAHRVYG